MKKSHAMSCHVMPCHVGKTGRCGGIVLVPVRKMVKSALLKSALPGTKYEQEQSRLSKEISYFIAYRLSVFWEACRKE